jgi:hypothetical protein
MRPEIILLDLNYTLIGDQLVSRYIRPIEKRVELEQYRMDLVEAVAGYRVFMLTARPERQKAATIAAMSRRIPELVLERAYFNTHDEQPPDAKLRMMRDFILPDGIDPASCFAIESNPRTRRMYATLGVDAAPYSARLVSRLLEAQHETLRLL